MFQTVHANKNVKEDKNHMIIMQIYFRAKLKQ